MIKVIFNGGDPSGDCPTDWDDAYELIEKMNANRVNDGPKWSFDCGFKLDFDGGLVSISSRFYTPK
jgi:hypothetical protein